jgi:fatty acid desaturase
MSEHVLHEPAAAAIDPYRRYRKTLLSPQRVRQLSSLRPARAVADTIWCWAWIVAAWAVVAFFPRWWTVALAIPVIGTQYYALLIVAHDGIHRRLFRNPHWNDWFTDLFIFGPVAAITRINNQNHLGHHRHLSSPADPDLHQFTCANKHQWHLFLGYLTGVTSLLRSFQNVFLRRGKVTGREPKAPSGPGQRYTFRDIALIAIWQLALIAGLSGLVAWWAYPVLWLVPLYCFAFLGDNLRAFAEHSQPEPDADADEHRLITFLSNPLERLFIAPLNMNYHAAHHLWPSIPYYNLPQADLEIRNAPAAEGLEWRGTYAGYLLHYFRLLPLTDCRPPPAAELILGGVATRAVQPAELPASPGQ